MKAGEIRELGADELEAKQREAKEQVFRLRFQMKMGQADSVKKYRLAKKDLARILTVERQRAAAGEAAAGEAAGQG